MPDLARFGVFMVAAFLLFFSVVRWVVRRRTTKPATGVLLALATVVVPMDFLRVPLTAAAGWLIYSERLDMFSVLGAALILTGNLMNLRASDPVLARAGT